MSDDVIPAGMVLNDIQRLATDGYQLVPRSNADGTVAHVELELRCGQRCAYRQTIMTAEVDKQLDRALVGMAAEVTRDLPLLIAMCDFLNVFGSPETLLRYAEIFSKAPQLSSDEFKLFLVEQDNTRTCFFKTRDGKVIKVYPDLYAEEMSDAEVDAELSTDDVEQLEYDV